MYDPSLERLIEVSLADGVLTDKEREVIIKKAITLGIDQDEIMVYVEGLLDEKKKSNRKSDKYGAKHTCPNCGAPVNPAAIRCEECGHMFNGVEASDVVKQFEEKVNQASVMARPGVIKRFPIPNTQEALFAMIEYLQPLCDEYGGTSLNPYETKAYQSKFRECMNRAKIEFPTHPRVVAYKKLDDKRKNKKTLIIIISILFLFSFVALTGYFIFNSEDSNSKVNETKETEEVFEDSSDEVLTADITEIPDGWDQMYMMSGQYEYCASEIINSEGTLGISLYANGMEFSFTPDDSDGISSVEFIIGKIKISAQADVAGVASAQVTDESTVSSIIKSFSKGEPVTVKYNGIESNFNLDPESAQAVRQAMQWVKSLTNGFEI